MNALRWLLVAALLGSAAAAFSFWQRAEQLTAQNTELRAALDALKTTRATPSAEEEKQRDYELKRLRADAGEVHKLRGELGQSRAGAKELAQLRSENLQLRQDHQQLRAASAGAAATPVASAPSAVAGATDQFPRQGWSFAGYQTPEAALISSLWSMREGNPQSYLQSLSPEEQARHAKLWETKTETDIAAKHQADVASITGLRVLERNPISPNEVAMSVYLEGLGRLEKVSMKLIGNEWKFGGYIRPAGK